MTIPLANIARQYEELKTPIDAAIAGVLTRQHFIQGPCVKQFEQEFAAFIGVPHAIGCSNGTSALSLALEVLGVKSGDEVITVSHTFIATAEAIYRVGATPVFIDIDPDSYTMAHEKIEAAITKKTRAIIPVHIYGTPCRMDEIMAIAKKHKLFVIEDAAQAHGATLGGRKVGSFGDAACFSFYPGKNLGAFGDAGAVVTSNEKIAERIRSLRDHGRKAKYEHDIIGANERMDEIQAAVLSAKLTRLSAWNEHRRKIADYYHSRLSGTFHIAAAPSGAKSVYHLWVAEVSNRGEVLEYLSKQGIGAGVHYPIPVHRQPAIASPLSLPVTQKAASRIVSLPICGHITEAEATRVCDAFLHIAKP